LLKSHCMKKMLFLPVCVILWSFTQSENPLEKYLTRITDPDIIKRDLATIAVWNSNPKREKDEKITPQSQWELLYYYHSGWHEHSPNQRMDISEVYVGTPVKRRYCIATIRSWRICFRKPAAHLTMANGWSFRYATIASVCAMCTVIRMVINRVGTTEKNIISS
jgi:hypothetical protein